MMGPIGERRLAVEPAMAVRKMNFCQSSRDMSADRSMSSLAALPASTNALSFASGFLSARPNRKVANWLVCLITPGEAMTCALSTTGKPYCWGGLSADLPKQVTPKDYPAAPAFSQLAVGGGHACALTADGSAYCWGDNRAGQLGDSSTVNRADPVAVKGGMKFKAISAGYEHTCAQTLDGSVACWGLNSVGELGDSISGPRLVPRYVVVGVNP